MPLRTLLRYLANNEKLVQKLAESYPIRRAAQLTLSLFYKSKAKMADVDPAQVNRLIAFLKRFASNFKEGIDDVKKQIKK